MIYSDKNGVSNDLKHHSLRFKFTYQISGDFYL